MSHISTRDSAIHPPLDGSVIQSVVLVDRVTRTTTGVFESFSLPGHLIHVVVEGHVEQRSAGALQRIVPGEAVWYHENEEVSGHVRQAPWTFYTVNFVAVRLAAPPVSHRVLPADEQVLELVETLLATWHDTSAPATRRHLRVHALLLNIIDRLLPESAAAHRIDSATDLWWEYDQRLSVEKGRREIVSIVSINKIFKPAGRIDQIHTRSPVPWHFRTDALDGPARLSNVLDRHNFNTVLIRDELDFLPHVNIELFPNSSGNHNLVLR